MVKSNRNLDQALKKLLLRFRRSSPHVFEHFVGLKKFSLVKKFDPEQIFCIHEPLWHTNQESRDGIRFRKLRAYFSNRANNLAELRPLGRHVRMQKNTPMQFEPRQLSRAQENARQHTNLAGRRRWLLLLVLLMLAVSPKVKAQSSNQGLEVLVRRGQLALDVVQQTARAAPGPAVGDDRRVQVVEHFVRPTQIR